MTLRPTPRLRFATDLNPADLARQERAQGLLHTYRVRDAACRRLPQAEAQRLVAAWPAK